MSIDDLARRAGQDLRQVTSVDVEAALEDLQRAVPRRRRAHAVAATCVVLAVLVLLAGTTRWLLPEASRVVPPANQPSVSDTSTPSVPVYDGCDIPLITCRGGRQYTVALRVPMDWTLPKGFGAPFSGIPPQPGFIETYLNFDAGLSVLEGVHAARNQADSAAVPGITTAEALTNWIAQRPFLSASRVRTGTVDGRRAWVVDVEVSPDLPPGPATCTNGITCYPVLLQGTLTTGAWHGITSRYTVLDLPGTGVTVLWSWALDGAVIPRPVDDLVQSIRFG
jgi:hypothetical protein